MVDNSLINGKVTLISTKLYPRIAFYHFLKFWKKYTTLALFLKGRLTKKRTETKYTKQNRANALLWNFFPHPAVGDIQLLFTISPLIILWFGTNFVSASNIFHPRLFCFWDSGIMSCYKREEEGGFFSINNDLIVLIKHARKIKRSCKAHKIVNSNRLLPDKRFANFWCRTDQFKLWIDTLF